MTRRSSCVIYLFRLHQILATRNEPRPKMDVTLDLFSTTLLYSRIAIALSHLGISLYIYIYIYIASLQTYSFHLGIIPCAPLSQNRPRHSHMFGMGHDNVHPNV